MNAVTLKIIVVDNYVFLFLKQPHNLDECCFSAVKQNTEIKKQDIHPGYVDILEKGIHNYQHRLVLE